MPALIWSLIRPVTFFWRAMLLLFLEGARARAPAPTSAPDVRRGSPGPKASGIGPKADEQSYPLPGARCRAWHGFTTCRKPMLVREPRPSRGARRTVSDVVDPLADRRPSTRRLGCARASKTMSSELGHLVEAELDGGLALEQRHEDGELAALRLDLADRARQSRERALLDGDRLTGLEVDLGGDRRASRGATSALGARSGALHRGLDDLHRALQHVERLLEPEGRRVVRVADEAGDARSVAHDRPRVLVEVHADEHVAGDAHAVHELALAVLDLDDVLHRDLHLEDRVLLAERALALLDVLLHALLEAGVGVDDVPLARLGAELLAERLVGVDRGLVIGLGLLGHALAVVAQVLVGGEHLVRALGQPLLGLAVGRLDRRVRVGDVVHLEGLVDEPVGLRVGSLLDRLELLLQVVGVVGDDAEPLGLGGLVELLGLAGKVLLLAVRGLGALLELRLEVEVVAGCACHRRCTDPLSRPAGSPVRSVRPVDSGVGPGWVLWWVSCRGCRTGRSRSCSTRGRARRRPPS